MKNKMRIILLASLLLFLHSIIFSAWEGFRTDNGRTAYSAADATSVQSLKLGWTINTGDTTCLSMPVSSGGYLYVGTGDGRLLKIRKAGGAVTASCNVKGSVDSHLLYHDSTVYFGTTDGYMCAADSDLDIIWEKKADAGISTCFQQLKCI